MDEDTTYEVVGYDDARAIAQDAAAAALAADDVRSDADVESVATSAADAAAADALAGAVDEISARVDEVAQKAADGAVQGVQDRLDSTLAAIDERSADLESAVVEVAITTDQYDAIMMQLRVMTGASFLSLCVSSALLGAIVWSMVSRGFR